MLVEGKAIRIHPLVCVPYNADFDGDQMAVHIPLSYEAQIESVLLMLSTNNILSPAHGKPLVSPTQEIVVGCYYLTKEMEDEKGVRKAFGDSDEVHLAIESGTISMHSGIIYIIDGKRYETTAGRVIFNEIVPEGLPFVNNVMDKKKLGELGISLDRLASVRWFKHMRKSSAEEFPTKLTKTTLAPLLDFSV